MITRNIEDYLETILILEEKMGYARVSDIAKKMGITYPSVSGMVKKLGELGYIHYKKYGKVMLTPHGKELAKDVVKRHNLWVSFLTSLGIDKENAKKDACKLEHDVSETSVEALSQFLDYILNSKEGKTFLNKFSEKEKGGI